MMLSRRSGYRRSQACAPSLPSVKGPQKYGAASSYGKKYALGNLLLIDDTADADASNDHSGKKAKITITSKKDPLYDKAIKFVQGGGDVTAITSKYSVSKEIQKMLTDAVPMKTETL